MALQYTPAMVMHMAKTLATLDASGRTPTKDTLLYFFKQHYPKHSTSNDKFRVFYKDVVTAALPLREERKPTRRQMPGTRKFMSAQDLRIRFLGGSTGTRTYRIKMTAKKNKPSGDII